MSASIGGKFVVSQIGCRRPIELELSRSLKASSSSSRTRRITDGTTFPVFITECGEFLGSHENALDRYATERLEKFIDRLDSKVYDAVKSDAELLGLDLEDSKRFARASTYTQAIAVFLVNNKRLFSAEAIAKQEEADARLEAFKASLMESR